MRGSKLAAARVADRVVPYLDRADFAEHLPLLGSAALMQLARDPATPVVTFGLETQAAGLPGLQGCQAAGFLPLLIHVGSQHVGRPRVGSSQQRARRTARVLYMRRDIVAACDAFNARVKVPPLAPCKIEQRLSSQQAAAACKIEIVEDIVEDIVEKIVEKIVEVDRSGNDNKVSLPATPS